MTTNNQNSEETLQQGGPQTKEQGQREQSGASPSPQTATVDAANQEETNIKGTSDELPPPPPPHVPNAQGDDYEPIYEPLGFWDIVKRCMVWDSSAYSGRATRKEYWIFFLFYVPLLVTVSFIEVLICNYAIGSEEYVKVMEFLENINLLLSIIFGFPTLSVTSRRLHDIGLNGWWCLINLIPCVNILFLVVMCMPSKKERNKYGPYVIN